MLIFAPEAQGVLPLLPALCRKQSQVIARLIHARIRFSSVLQDVGKISNNHGTQHMKVKSVNVCYENIKDGSLWGIVIRSYFSSVFSSDFSHNQASRLNVAMEITVRSS